MQRFAIREGWTTVFLTSMIVFISVWSIQRADWADGLGILNLVALAGLAAGVAVSKNQRLPAAVAHLLAAFAGLLVVLYQMTSYLDDRLGTRRQKLDWLWDRGQRWGEQIWNGEQTDDLYLFVFFISVLTYVLAFSSMWFVLRARWIWAALVFPGLLLFINLGYSLRVPTGYVALYIFFALLLLVRFSLLERETLWRRMRIDYPSSLAWRGMWAATYLGIFILVFGWAFPASARSQSANDAWLQVDGPWRTVESQFNDWFAGLRGTSSRGVGGFASFSDSFDLGGPLSLSDTPVVLVSGASNSPYLAAHRYSIYTGRGWESEFVASDDEDDEPRAVPPQVELQPGESVVIDPAIVDGRETRRYTIQMQRPRGSLVFAPETFSSADLGVNLVLPWRTVTDATIDLTAEELNGVPAELLSLILLLQNADFMPEQPANEPTEEADAIGTVTPTGEPDAATPEITPTPPPSAVEPLEITQEKQALIERGIVVDYDLEFDAETENYQATLLTYSGEFPVYDDVEAVYARNGLAAGQSYEVESLESRALSDDLRTAGVDYPQRILDRYLQLPETVTPRTIQLAQEITAGTSTTYDAGKAIETWLRANILYKEDIEFPPEDRDVVDYVLFDSREGYCEYYASSFIVMMRALGIPTRMVTGFFPADRDAEAGGFLYRERNAHAWPEVYFPGEGWVPFEPTANREVFSRDPAPASDAGVPPVDPAFGDGVGGMLPDDFELQERGGGPVGGGAAIQQADDPVSRAEWAIRAVTLGLMAAILLIAFFWLRGMRGLSPAAQLYTKAARGAGWGGVRYESHMTPHEYTQAVAKAVPGSRGPATFLADVYVRETYGNRPPAQMDLQRARQAWQRLRGVLVKHFFTRLRPWRTAPVDDVADDDLW